MSSLKLVRQPFHAYLNVFEDLSGGALAKKITGYHLFDAVNVGVE
jgi:hypothetical protein